MSKLPPTLSPFATSHPASSAYRITLSPHEWEWTQEEQEAIARALVELDGPRQKRELTGDAKAILENLERVLFWYSVGEIEMRLVEERFARQAITELSQHYEARMAELHGLLEIAAEENNKHCGYITELLTLLDKSATWMRHFLRLRVVPTNDRFKLDNFLQQADLHLRPPKPQRSRTGDLKYE